MVKEMMWTKIKKNQRSIVLTAIALAAGMALGVLIGIAIPNSSEEPAAQTGNMGVASILPTTKMERQVYFSKCAHSCVLQLDPAGFVGYTKEELERFYKDYPISRFDGEQVVVIQMVDGYCPKHHILRLLDDGTLAVYHPDEEVYTEQIERILDFDPSELPQEDQIQLRNGMAFDTLADIDAYLESAES